MNRFDRSDDLLPPVSDADRPGYEGATDASDNRGLGTNAPAGSVLAGGVPEGIDWHAVEMLAIELATLAGGEITAALSRGLMISYKSAPGTYRDPVSEVDRNVEVLIRARLSEQFPDHGVLGEEIDDKTDAAHDVIWAVDPVDGTNNFINGFPWFSASIGVLHRGMPIVGATWCSTSHVLRPGVYHACCGGSLHFDGQSVGWAPNPAVRRRLAGYPGTGSQNTPWDNRRTGSAAMECAMVAAGPLQLARFENPFVWDVAGGVALALAAGREVRVRDKSGWRPFDGFATPDARGQPVVSRMWRKSLLLGEADAVETACVLMQQQRRNNGESTR
ncbi:MAG: inositol monophosphatase [Burkholderiaceae bacterium]